MNKLRGNTVILSLEKYNQLYSFYTGIQEGKFITLGYRDKIYCRTKDKIVADLKSYITRLEKENYELKEKLKK